MVGKSDIDGIEPSRQQDMHILRSLAQKGRLRTLSSSLESRKFIFGEDTATKASMLGVLYLQPSYEVVPYNISWRGLLVLLILRIGNARALDWDKRVQTPTSFHILLSLIS